MIKSGNAGVASGHGEIHGGSNPAATWNRDNPMRRDTDTVGSTMSYLDWADVLNREDIVRTKKQHDKNTSTSARQETSRNKKKAVLIARRAQLKLRPKGQHESKLSPRAADRASMPLAPPGGCGERGSNGRGMGDFARRSSREPRTQNVKNEAVKPPTHGPQ